MKFLSNIKNWISWRLINQLFPRLVEWFQSRSPQTYALLIAFGTSLAGVCGYLAVELNQHCAEGIFCNTTLEAWLVYIGGLIGIVIDILSGKRPAEDITNLPDPPREE